MARHPAGLNTGLCRLTTLREAHIEILRRLGATVGHLTQVPRAVLNNPRVHMAHLDRTHRGTHRQDPQEHLTHDRLSHHTRAMSEAVPLSHQRSHRVRLAQAQGKARPAPCRQLRIRSTRPICRRMGLNHRHTRATRHRPGQRSRPRQTHMILTLI